MSKEDNYYINNEDMIEEIQNYKENKVISERLGGMFLYIATNFANKGNFAGYTWKEDMIGEAVYTCVRYAHNFDLNKSKNSNPFAYFTQICYHSFINYIKKQKKHSKIKDRCYNLSEILKDKFNDSIDYEDLR